MRLSHDSTWDSPSTTIVEVDSPYQPEEPLAQGQWFWQAWREDEAGHESRGPVCDFVIDTTSPSAPLPLEPPDGRVALADTIILRWSSTDTTGIVSSPEYYFLHVSKRDDFSDYETYYGYVYDERMAFSRLLLDSAHVYLWRVKTLDSAGNFSEFSSTFRFFTGDFVCGDVNRDAKINLADITGIVSDVYLGSGNLVPVEAADVTGDGKINLGDITQLISYVYIEQAPLNCPAM
jgi:hypothetical protein